MREYIIRSGCFPIEHVDNVLNALIVIHTVGGKIASKRLIAAILKARPNANEISGPWTISLMKDIFVDLSITVHAMLSIRDFQRLEIKRFSWMSLGRCCGYSEIEEWHKKLNGQIFNFDNPPIINPHTGERGFPGQMPFCRCTMSAEIDM